MTSIYVSALKSFGDFTIALRSLERIAESSDVSTPVLLAGQHLHSLAAALEAERRVRFIGDSSWADVPAAFNVGKRGKVAAIRSLFELRGELKALDKGSSVVFDRIGLRERFIAHGHRQISLPSECDNIYEAYSTLFAQLGYQVTPATAPHANVVRKAVLVPGSRIPRKALPVGVVTSIHSQLSARGIEVTAVKLEGESVDVPADVPAITLPRSFAALVSVVRTSDMVISADSLSAHLGEYYHLPTFVVTPVPNRYWLPPVALGNHAWATFDNLSPLAEWLSRYAALPGLAKRMT